MVTYRNVKNGRVVERPSEDEWLEASDGWERVDEFDEPTPEKPKGKAAVSADIETPNTGDDERTDD